MNFINIKLVITKLVNLSELIKWFIFRRNKYINNSLVAAFPGFLPVDHIPCTPQSRTLSRQATDLEASARILDIMSPILSRNYAKYDDLRQALVKGASDMHKQALDLDLEARASRNQLLELLFNR